MSHAWQLDYSDLRKVPGHGLCGIHQMCVTWGLFEHLTAWGYKGRYCFEHEYQARAALAQWTGKGDPPGAWIKYKGRNGERLGPAIASEA